MIYSKCYITHAIKHQNQGYIIQRFLLCYNDLFCITKLIWKNNTLPNSDLYRDILV